MARCARMRWPRLPLQRHRPERAPRDCAHRATTILAAGVTGADAAAGEPGTKDEEARAQLALQIDQVMRESAPAGWKGDQVREAQVLNALFPLLNRDRNATLALFELIKNQPGY